jgi:hypothetical protein
MPTDTDKANHTTLVVTIVAIGIPCESCVLHKVELSGS